MSKDFKLNGIYDNKTMLLARSMRIYDLSFDFRPKSFNFIQCYKLSEIIESFDSGANRYYLHFSNEADFAIEKILKDTKEALNKKFGAGGIYPRLFLEFSDDIGPKFYDQFNTPYLWHYTPDSNIRDIIDSRNIAGIVISYSTLDQMNNDGTLFRFLSNFMQSYYQSISQRAIKLILHIDWDSEVSETILDYFDFDIISLSINNKVEEGYRQISSQKVTDYFRPIAKLMS